MTVLGKPGTVRLNGKDCAFASTVGSFGIVAEGRIVGAPVAVAASTGPNSSAAQADPVTSRRAAIGIRDIASSIVVRHCSTMSLEVRWPRFIRSHRSCPLPRTTVRALMGLASGPMPRRPDRLLR